MAADRSPTGKVLEALWGRWAKRHEHQFGTRPSKRQISDAYFEGDPNLLARWTGAAGRPRWRFPLSRLDELVTTLELTEVDIDDLMYARIEELQHDDEVIPLLTWLARFLERTSLDQEEREVLAAWRTVRAQRRLGFYRDGRQADELRRVLDGLLGIHETRHTDDQEHAQAEEAKVTDADREALQERAREVGRRLAAGSTAHKRQLVRAKAVTKALLKRLREGKKRSAA